MELNPQFEPVLRPLVGRSFLDFDDLELAVLREFIKAKNLSQCETYREVVENGQQSKWIVQNADGSYTVVGCANQDGEVPHAPAPAVESVPSFTFKEITRLLSLYESQYIPKDAVPPGHFKDLVARGFVELLDISSLAKESALAECQKRAMEAILERRWDEAAEAIDSVLLFEHSSAEKWIYKLTSKGLSFIDLELRGQ